MYTKELLTKDEILTAWLAGLHFGEYFHLFSKEACFMDEIWGKQCQ